MRSALLAIPLTLLISFGSSAAPSADVSDTGGPDDAAVAQGEYIRLRTELKKLAQRNAWTGVERTYQAMLATGAALSFEDHKHGAHAAQAVGDLTATRERLMKANKIQEDPEVLDWLWDIDSSFGRVDLKTDPGRHALAPVQMPFNPTHAKAVQYAVAQVEETGTYNGLLPQGDYTFGSHKLTVRPRVQAMQIDLSTNRPARGLFGGKKKKE